MDGFGWHYRENFRKCPHLWRADGHLGSPWIILSIKTAKIEFSKNNLKLIYSPCGRSELST